MEDFAQESTVRAEQSPGNYNFPFILVPTLFRTADIAFLPENVHNAILVRAAAISRSASTMNFAIEKFLPNLQGSVECVRMVGNSNSLKIN